MKLSSVGIACSAAVVALATSATVASGGSGRVVGPITLRGTDGQNVRPFTLKADSNIAWRCSGCAGSNFIFATDQGIPVNALGPTRGKSFLQKGRYTGLRVIASGTWSIRITRAPRRPVRSSYVLTGTDGQNLAPFVLTHDSDVSWSCPSCSDANFIFSTDQDIAVNALGPTKGKSFLQRGRYTGVSVVADGRWKIVIR
jgi:hypothetical protein